MRRFIYTPIHTIPIDLIFRIVKEDRSVDIHIIDKSTCYIARPKNYSYPIYVDEIYEDIQRQLMGDK